MDSFVKDSAHFVQILEGLEMSNNSFMVSFDVKSLFTNVQVDEALQVIRICLEDDDSLLSRTTLSVDSIIELLTSHHHAHVKTGIIRTLLQRSKRICNSKEALTKEREHICEVFKNNGYTTSFINRAMSPVQPKSTPEQEYITTVTLPYIKGTSEQVRRILGRANIRVAFRTKTTIRSLLTLVKPAQSSLDMTGVIYSIPCKDCDKVYVGETGRTLNIRQKEHCRHLTYGRTDSSAVAAHAVSTLHDIDWENSYVLEHEDNFFKRKVKEALLIHTHQNFNLDDGLAVSPVWTSLL